MKWVGKSDIKVWMGEKESYQGNMEEWMDGVHYVKRLVRLINLCTASTISMFRSAVQASLPNNKKLTI